MQTQTTGTKMMTYTWIDGEFYLKEPKQWFWRHLSEYPFLYQRNVELHNANCLETLDVLGWANCDESEGWFLVQSWHGGINEIRPTPKGFAKWLQVLGVYVRIGYRNAGFKSLPDALRAFTLHWLNERN